MDLKPAKLEALLARHASFDNFQDGLQYTVNAALTKDNHYTLFRWEDWPAWVTFTAVFAVLIVFDNAVLHRNPTVLTVSRAVLYTFFWMIAACGFCCWVWCYYGANSAYMWMSGYMLEWMLSFDNLFVFHLIFTVYGTPDHLKHRPLYLGILGAVVFRLGFLFIGEYLMHAMNLMHFVFGAFLVYTGYKTVGADDDDEDPSQQPLVKFLQDRVPFVGMYCDKGSFFVRVPINEKGHEDIPETAQKQQLRAPKETDAILESGKEDAPARYNSVDFESLHKLSVKNQTAKFEYRATMLFLVVCCLEISDLLFAVDSVSAIVAQVNDLFLAYTSAVFAMLGLRATFFIIDVLVQLFSLMKYGVAIVLMFIGVKLIIGHVYTIHASIVCVVLVTAIAGSMVASVIQDKLAKKELGQMSPELVERVAKITSNSPFASPMPPTKQPLVKSAS
jgi:tellurite resistance protein TerC